MQKKWLKLKFWKNKKIKKYIYIIYLDIYLDISSFYICVLKVMIIIMLYCSWDMAHGECNFILFFHFALFFCPFTPILARKIKVLKYEKKRLEISFYIVYQKLWSNDVLFLRHSARRTDGQMDGQTDGRTEKVTQR